MLKNGVAKLHMSDHLWAASPFLRLAPAYRKGAVIFRLLLLSYLYENEKNSKKCRKL